MCGIHGVLGAQDEQAVHEGLSIIQHRGFSNFEMQSFKRASLGCNRLEIVDRSNGQQPMTNEDGTVAVVMNGEVFNHAQLREELEKKGHTFKTACDTEVLVHLYEEYGEEFITHIDTEELAFILWDESTQTYILGRDRIGVKPLFYGEREDGAIEVGSEMKQLTQRKVLNIKEVPKASFIVNGKISQYWKPPKRITRPREEVFSELSARIEEAVRKRVQTDLPIGVFLSGGVDSSLMMAIAHTHHDDVTGIILGKPGSRDHDAAVKLCKEKNYTYHVVEPRVNVTRLPELAIRTECDEFRVVRGAIANDLVSAAARELGLKIVLVGEGADEMFGGYNEFEGFSSEVVEKITYALTMSLDRGHNRRVDRNAMAHTVEVRVPLLDTAVVETALSTPGKFLNTNEKGEPENKSILRQVAAKWLPEYIAYRRKLPFSTETEVVDTDSNWESEYVAFVDEAFSDEEMHQAIQQYPELQGQTKENVFYGKLYRDAKYTQSPMLSITTRGNMLQQFSKN